MKKDTYSDFFSGVFI